MKPNYDYLPDFYKAYVSLVEDKALLDTLTKSKENCVALFRTISEKQGEYAYDKGKWSIKELVNHIIDAERVFVYRALTFARNDQTELPGFDEKQWTPASKADNRTLGSIVSEYEHLSASTLLLFKSFDSNMLNRKGIASGAEFNVANIGFIIAGHETHHANILRERYLK